MTRLFPLLLLLLLATACKGGSKSSRQTAVVRPVKTALVVSRNEVVKEYAAVVESSESVQLAFRVGGQIIEFPVTEGQQVAKGDLIAAIDPRDLELEVAATKAAYQTARLQLERNQRLLERQAISQQEYEISRASYEQAKSANELALNNLADARILAPFAGSIESGDVDNFQRVSAGTPVVKLINTDLLQVSSTLPDNNLYLLQTPDKSFTIRFDAYPTATFRATLGDYLAASPNGSGIAITLYVDDPAFAAIERDIKPGFACTVALTAQLNHYLEEPMLWVPITALFSNPTTGQQFVWVVDANNRVQQRPVVVYTPAGESDLYLSSGVVVGERVVTAGVYQLVENEEVRILP